MTLTRHQTPIQTKQTRSQHLVRMPATDEQPSGLLQITNQRRESLRSRPRTERLQLEDSH